jgi:hypothetical protein
LARWLRADRSVPVIITVHAGINKLTMLTLATFKNGAARQCSDDCRINPQGSDGW